jgi:hypothetical protein
MVFDGFYPNYFSQKKRVLFIGRETRDMAESNYIEVLLNEYRTRKRIGNQLLDNHKFHSRMIYIAYGILNDDLEWQKIPYASEIGDTFGTKSGLSFAFMNISKLSNEGENWPSNWDTINTSVRLSTEGRNFIQEEIAILEPDIIIAMNLKEKYNLLGDRIDWVPETEGLYSGWLDSCGHRSLLIDSWHFSAPGMDSIKDYYVPSGTAIKRREAANTR